MRTMKLAPSVFGAGIGNLSQQLKILEENNVELLHVDVMDGHFVPNISYGAAVMKSLCGKTALPFDVHLMIENPDQYLEDFVTDQTEYITVHQEACPHLHRTLQHIKGVGVKAGVALNPATPLSVLDYVLEEVDLILIMSVNPGFGGQKFIPSALRKVQELEEIRRKRDCGFVIEIDGGINLQNVKKVTDAGVQLVVAGSSVFGAENIGRRVNEFLELF